jgi:serine/threonine protein phosphatase PrpC
MTARISTVGPPRVAVGPGYPLSSLVEIDVDARSHPGYHRANNEDHFFVTRLGRTLQTMITSLPAEDVPARTEEVNYVMVVADGMGGHAAGEIASRMAISALVSLALDVPDWIFKVDDKHAPEIERRARKYVQEVGAMLVERGRRDAALHGMGTTLTAVRSFARDLLITHVGDSRAYLLRAGGLHRLTRDHTFAQLLVDGGHLAPGEVAGSRHRHVLTNALGGTIEDVQVDTDQLQLEDGDRLLLCSDGLTDLVDDQTITNILRETTRSSDACERLVQQALDNGGRDNVTVIVAAYRLPKAPERSQESTGDQPDAQPGRSRTSRRPIRERGRER